MLNRRRHPRRVIGLMIFIVLSLQVFDFISLVNFVVVVVALVVIVGRPLINPYHLSFLSLSIFLSFV